MIREFYQTCSDKSLGQFLELIGFGDLELSFMVGRGKTVSDLCQIYLVSCVYYIS